MTDSQPLVVAADGAVREQITRLAAAVGCEIDCVDSLVAARSRWAGAPLVLVDETFAARAANELPRRAGVLLVCSGPPTGSVWQRAFAMGVDKVLALPDDEDVLVSALGDAVERPSPRRGQVLAVVGGRGGAGASVFAAGVGVAVSRTGGSALLVDCDPFGGGLDLLFGAEGDAGLRWPGVRVSSGRVSMAELDAALPWRRHGNGRLSLLSCDRTGSGPTGGAVGAVVEAGRRAGRTVVCDLPRRADPCADEALRRADLVVLVVPAEVRACVAGLRVLVGLGERGARARVLVRGPARDGLTTEDVAAAVGAPALGWMRPERGLARSIECGVFNPRRKGALDTAARTVLDALRETAS